MAIKTFKVKKNTFKVLFQKEKNYMDYSECGILFCVVNLAGIEVCLVINFSN